MAVAVVVVILGAGVALAVTEPGYGGSSKVPVVGIRLDPSYSPEAGKTKEYNFNVVLSKTMPLTIKYIKPVAVLKAHYSPKPTKFVDGNPIWELKSVAANHIKTIHLWLPFAKGLPNGRKVNESFVLSSRGYADFKWHTTQHVYNPPGN